jgi:hypothetical protein
MNAYEKATQLGLTGTDAEIVVQLQATGITARAIALPDLLHLMNFRGMLTKLVSNQTDEKWTGTVLAMKAALVAAGQTESVIALDRWLSHITNPRNLTFDTRYPAHGAPFWAMRQGFGDVATMPTIADFDAVADLGGGWLYATLTEAEYAAQKAAGIANAAKNGLRERVYFEKTQFDARANTALAGIEAGTVTSGAEILAVLNISEG